MKKLNFTPAKSKEDFRKNYELHDLAEYHGKNLLTQWGIDFKNFGEDKRYEKVWESGADKPDVVITEHDKTAFIDWKAKQSSKYLINERAYNSYLGWSEKQNIPVIIVFFMFDDQRNLTGKKAARLGIHTCVKSKQKQWDKNTTVEFTDELPDFTRQNLIKLIS